MSCKIRTYNARQARLFGVKMTPTDNIVCLVSDPQTHCEFQFSERYKNISFSSTLTNGDKGCRFKDIGYSHPEYWDTLILPMTDEEEDRAYARALELDGKLYDLIGVAGLASEHNIIKQDPNKYWCSEAVAELIIAGKPRSLNFVPSFYTPRALFFEVFHLAGVSIG
jgi:hypothetical protein